MSIRSHHQISTVAAVLSMPAVGKVSEITRSKEVADAYNAPATLTKRTALTGGALVTYAPGDASDKGDPRLPTSV